MSTIPEQLSTNFSNSSGKPDSNLSNDSNNLGGIPANEYATKEWVKEYHDGKEENLKRYIDGQDQSILEQAKEYTNSQIRNQDFSGFAELKDLQALNENLQQKITEGDNAQKAYVDQKIQQVVDDTNANFSDVSESITKLNNNLNSNVNTINGKIDTINGNINNMQSNIDTMSGQMKDLFQSVSDGKSKIAGAITDKGVPTSASASYDTMATNIRAIPTDGGGEIIIPPGYYDTSDANITANDVAIDKIAYGATGRIVGTLVPGSGIDTSGATATAGDIRYGKTAYARGQLLVRNNVRKWRSTRNYRTI
mgnify:FL=1